MKKAVCVLGACLLLAGSLYIGYGVAESGTSSQTAFTPCIQHEKQDAYSVPDEVVVTISRTTNPSVVRFSFNEVAGRPDMAVTFPRGVTITDTKGFSVDGRSAAKKYNTHHPWVEVRLGSPHDRVKFTASEQSLITPLPDSRQTELFFRPQPTGYVGAQFALIGNYTLGTAHVGCQRIQVVAPVDAPLPEAPEHYADALAKAGADLAIGHRYRSVTAFVAPKDIGKSNGYTPLIQDGFAEPSSEFYISPQARLNNPSNTWVHEYVHTRQASAEPSWAREGAATYITTQISVEEGWLNPREADRYYAQRAGPNGLPAVQKTGARKYFQGAFFFSQVNRDLHGSTTTFEDVYRSLNKRATSDRSGDHFDASAFESVVEKRTGVDVNYSDPTEAPVAIIYIGGPSWLPPSIRQLLPDLPEVGFLVFVITVGWALEQDAE